MRNNIQSCQEMQHLIAILQVIPNIFKFLSITCLEGSIDDYNVMLDKYEDNVKRLYHSAKYTLFNGNKVSFYFHVIRFYFPKIAKITLEKHSLGMGIFTMQGFERINKESKNFIARASTFNRKNKTMLYNNLRKLLQLFMRDKIEDYK